MNKHALSICLISALVAATSGCCELGAFLSCPLGACGPICAPAHCCDGAYCEQCGPACGVCDPAGAPCVDTCVDTCCDGCGGGGCEACCDPCGDACGDCGGDVCCDPCCDPCGGSCWSGCGPLSWLFGGLGWGCGGSGCGEFYWSDFYSEPPDCCDPCDRWGNWIGGSCGGGDCGGGGNTGYCAVKPLQKGYAAGKAAPATQVAIRPPIPAKQVSQRSAPPTRRVAKRSAAPTRQVAKRAGPGNRRAVPGWALRGLESEVITDPSSPYAPKLVSVTDHAPSSTPPESAPAGQTASARQTDVRQTSTKQVVTPRKTYASR